MRRSLPLLALVLFASPARAQDSTKATGTFLLGVGADLRRVGPRTTGAPLALQVGYQWSRPTSRLGVRLFGDYSTSAGGYTFVADDYLSSSSSSSRTFDAGAAVTYALSRTRIQPYLIGGVGVAQSSMRASGVFVTGATAGAPLSLPGAPQVTNYSSSGWNGFLQVGFGAQTRVRGVTLFGELRENAGFDIPGTRWGGRSGEAAPLTFGVRFD